MKKIILSLLTTSAILFVSAQTFSFRLLDAATKYPIVEATVSSNNNNVTTSNELGYTLAQGDSVKIVAVGYKSISVNLKNLASNNEIIYLQKSNTALSDIIISTNTKVNYFKTFSNFDLHVRPIVNSQEVLRVVPGLFIGQHAGGGKAEQIFLRGFDIDHGTDINITVDDMPVNMVSHAHGQGYADLHFVIPELIETVDFDKGPYNANKGNFTTAGYVAFKTKKYLERNFVKFEGGQYNSNRFVFAQNILKRKNNNSLFVAGEASYTSGYFESPQKFNRTNFTVKYNNELSSSTLLSTTATAFNSKWLASGQIPARSVADGSIGFFGAIDDKEGGNTSRYNLNLTVAHRINASSTLNSNIFYTKNNFTLYSNFTFFKQDSINGDQIKQAENRTIVGLNSNYKNIHQFIGHRAEFNSGVQIRQDYVNDLELSSTKDRTTTLSQKMFGNVKELNVAAYLSEKINFSKKLELSAGLRVDYFKNIYEDKITDNTFNSNATILSPKLNINYALSSKVQLYWSNGIGFHSNDTRVAALQNGRKVLPAALGSDIGAILKLNKKLMIQTAFWRLKLQQEFVYVGDEGVVEPGGETSRYGIDVTGRYEINKAINVDVNVSYANPRALGVNKAESYIPLAPTFTSVGGLTYKSKGAVNGTLRYRFMADRAANETNTTVAKGYFVVDAAINYTKAKWEASLGIQNLMNTKWRETQFETESRLRNEPDPISEIHFTPGTPFFARASLSFYF